MAGSKKRLFNRGPILLSALFVLLIQFTAVQGQVSTVVLRSNGWDATSLPLHRFSWHYQSGDSVSWANPGLDDNKWDTSAILFGDKNLPTAWNGIGWFRLWIKRDASSTVSMWGLKINHDAASEVYWDGVKIATLGRVGHSKRGMDAERAPFLAIPLAITDTNRHLLAIRFSNYNGYFADFIGFQAWIGSMQSMSQQLRHDKDRNDSLLISVAVQLTLVLIHLFLFLYYRREKLNLYFSLFVSCNAAAIYAKYVFAGTSLPAIQVLADKSFFCATVGITFTGGVFLYGVGYSRLPIRRVVLIAFLSALFICAITGLNQNATLIRNGSLWVYNNVFFCLVFIDGLWSVLKGIRRRRPGIWLIVIGMLVTGVLSIVIGSDVFGWMHGNYQDIISAMAFVTLIMPVCWSIYLAKNFAFINHNLAQQLIENKILAERNLIQEQEKTNLITGQAEQLERTVIQRTEQLRLQAEQLKELDTVKSRWFVNLTHEFKTPLTLIINPARELLRQSDSEATQRYAAFILQSGERLLELTDQLLDLSRLESGQMEIRMERLELVGWLRSHIERYQSLAIQKELALNFLSNSEQVWIDADPDKLEKIVQNLLSNALKFASPGGTIKVALEITNYKDDSWFNLIIQDDGPGIPSEKLPYIFDRFYQADLSDTRTKEGTGIGLALTKELTEFLGGTIAVTSPGQKGTKFIVSLPYKSVEAGPASEEKSATEKNGFHAVPEMTGVRNESTEGAPHRQITDDEDGKPLILVMEDNDNLRQFLRQSLSDTYRVVLAKDGAEGIQAAFGHVPDLVITDLMMPCLDGFQVCTTLKTDVRSSHIPVIMLTAKTSQDSRIMGLETGADAYLTKPFDKRELLVLIENCMRIRLQLRERYGKNNVWLTEPAVLPSLEKKFLDLVRQAVTDHLDDPGYGAERLGIDAGFSRTQLHRKLKELIGQSPGELIRTVRMQRAYELLQQKVATVAEVCYMVGYANPSNFSTSFSRHFGFPPSEVLKQRP